MTVTAVSLSCPSNNRTSSMSEVPGQGSDWRERLRVNPSRMEQELAYKLQENRISYLIQVEIPVTTADFYFPSSPRPLLVFVDGQVHLGKIQAAKDEELRTLLRKKGYKVLECGQAWSNGWLIFKHRISRPDFFLPQYNLVVEYWWLADSPDTFSFDTAYA